MRQLIVVMSLFISSLCFAQENPQLKMRTGDNFVASGVMIPKSLFDELQTAEKALRNARLEVSREAKTVNKNKENLELLKASIEHQQEQFRKFVNRVAKNVSVNKEDLLKLQKDLLKLRRDLEFRSIAVGTWLDVTTKQLHLVITELNNLETRVNNLEQKEWKLAVHGLANFDWNTKTKDWEQFNMLGVSAFFMDEKKLVTTDVSAGLNSLNKQFSWALGLSGEYRLTNSLSLGGSALLSQDLGNLEGVETITGSIGPVLRFMHLTNDWKSFSVSLSPCRIGFQGNKEKEFNGNPDWYPNFGALLTLDYFIL